MCETSSVHLECPRFECGAEDVKVEGQESCYIERHYIEGELANTKWYDGGEMVGEVKHKCMVCGHEWKTGNG